MGKKKCTDMVHFPSSILNSNKTCSLFVLLCCCFNQDGEMHSAERKKGSETKTEAERLKYGEGGCMDMGGVAVILRGTEQSV